MALAGLLAAASLPAQAKSSRPKQHGGKKAVGEITSFDRATLTLSVDLPGDDDFTGAVDPDVQVKLDHRGWNKRGGGNPTKGSLDDLLPGTPVLRMKVEDDLVTKIRLRPTGEESPLPPAEDGDEDEDALPGDDTPSDDTPADGGDDSADDSDDSDEPTDDSDDSDDDSDDSDGDDADTNPDDEDLGDPEDALPPLPVSQP
ncbi:MAG: hypothetical protein M3134_05105 [Actinomycetota bacterium]|nr:hypothetical protein [Actinomycetota bacterium]